MDNFEGEKKTKKSVGLIVALLLVIIIVAAGAGCYLFKTSKPSYVFEKAIDSLFAGNIETKSYKTAKVTTNITAKVKSDEEGIEEVADLINDAKLTVVSEIDTEKKEDFVGLKLTKASDELVDAKLMIEEESKNMYVDLGEFFDKTIQVDLSEVLEDEAEITDTKISSFGKMLNGLKAEQIIKETIKNELKEEYFSSEKVEIDGKKVTKNEMKVSGKETVTILKNIVKNLSENEEFLSCYEDKDDIKETLENALDSFEDADVEEDGYMIIDIYTSGITQKIERVDITVDSDDEKVTMQVAKKAEGLYSYKLSSDASDDKIEGEVKINISKESFEFGISMKYEETEIALNIDGNVEYDKELDTVDTKKAVNVEDLSEDDMYEIIGNFAESKLYEIIEEIEESSYDEYDYDYDEEDDDEYYTFDYDEDDE